MAESDGNEETETLGDTDALLVDDKVAVPVEVTYEDTDTNVVCEPSAVCVGGSVPIGEPD